MKTISRILGEARTKWTDPHLAYMHAKHVIRGRWPEGEAIIATDPYWSYCYAFDVVKGRWPEGEVTIAKSPRVAINYALDVIKGRWPEVEEVIAKSVLREEFPFTASKEEYLETFPDAKDDWILNGWLDWLDT
jgi:hypothetical protein